MERLKNYNLVEETTTKLILLNSQIKQENNKADDIFNITLIGVGLAMGICIVVTSILKQIDITNAITMLGVGLSCLSIYLLKNKKDKK